MATLGYGNDKIAAILAIKYEKTACEAPFAIIISMSGLDIGTVVSNKFNTGIFSKMIWEIDGNAFEGKTMYVEFTHGFQYVMRAEPNLINALRSSKIIKVTLPKSVTQITFQPGGGFLEAVSKAKEYECR